MKKAWSFLTVALLSGAAFAHPHHDDPLPGARGIPAQRPATERPYGQAGDRASVSRTIALEMTDSARCSPGSVTVKRGETVRLLARNSGRQPQELAIGTQAELKEHAGMLKKFPTMQVSVPHRALANPGDAAEILWHFTRAGEFAFTCAPAGHLAPDGMGKLLVSP
jgi:uncharacterized cupredoxin-like copper-binding protein